MVFGSLELVKSSFFCNKILGKGSRFREGGGGCFLILGYFNAQWLREAFPELY